MLYKTIDNSVMDVDDRSRYVKVAISETGSKDLDNDVIEQTAFSKTISERGPGAANLIWHLTDHMPMLKYAVGKFSYLQMEGSKLIGGTTIPNTTWGNDVLEFYKSGAINQHSIGFKPMRTELMNQGKEDQYQVINEIKLYEGSAVLWGANPNTPTISVGKSIEEKKSELDKLLAEHEILLKSLRKSNFTDDTAELIEMHIDMLCEKIKNIFSSIATQAADKAPAPVQEKKFAEQLFLTTLIR